MWVNKVNLFSGEKAVDVTGEGRGYEDFTTFGNRVSCRCLIYCFDDSTIS